ncbi:hypothetical protein OG874_32285 [Nocardia sp. NBC_00565]|uniref:hypothetical protein n=1 Tax=Nocardia sp. NBC_00565 TaxID=2975993 RepID=UPI002E80B793|nr:hypothetical protein [Nocardia sp. NBC_00565]WUC01447.1 hypothetical protein OG874_32285 [Nocardia sp. NBC_00565]
MKEKPVQPKAIGLLLLDIAGSDRPRYEQVIRHLAQRQGYELAGLLTIGTDTYMPTTLVVETVCKAGASAILAPDLAHFNGHAKAISLACDLVTADGIVPRSGGER